MNFLFLLFIIILFIFIVPILSILQIALRVLFGKKDHARSASYGQQRTNDKGHTTWYTHTQKNKKKIDSSEGEYIDFEDIKEK